MYCVARFCFAPGEVARVRTRTAGFLLVFRYVHETVHFPLVVWSTQTSHMGRRCSLKGLTADAFAVWWMPVSFFSHVIAATPRLAVAAANQFMLFFILSDTYEGLLQ